MEYQDIINGNLFSVDPKKSWRAKGFYNPTTKDSMMQPWFPYEHKDNLIGMHHYDWDEENQVIGLSHKFIADKEFGGKTYLLNHKE